MWPISCNAQSASHPISKDTTWLEVVNKAWKEQGKCKADTLDRVGCKQLICKGSGGGLLVSCSLEDECLALAHPGVPGKLL